MAAKSYTVVGRRVVAGVEPGGTVTEKAITERGGDVEHLVATGHIAPKGASSKSADGGEE